MSTTGIASKRSAAATAAATAPVGPRRRWRRPETLAGYLFIAPALLHSLVFIVAVVFVSALISTWDWDLLSPPEFVGVENYTRLFRDGIWLRALQNTAIFVVLSVPVSIALSLAIALAANTKLRGMTFFRTAYFFPYVASMVSVAIVFRWLYNKDYGLINGFLGIFGIDPVDWLGSCTTALPAVAFVSVWKGLGFNMTLFLAGLQAIPTHLYEAAQLDGAGRWQQFRDITWPLLSPTTFFVSITSMLGFFQTFDSVFLLTGGSGGPERCTLLYLTYLQQQGWQFFRMGYAASMSWVLFAFLLVITFVQFKVLNKRVNYELG
jgi:multiple sugar transport system permease protein